MPYIPKIIANDPLTTKIAQVLTHYPLGELVDYTPDQRGFVNKSYAIHTNLGGNITPYFLRQYKLGILEEELIYEHSLINHVFEVGLPPVARVYRTREGTTFVREDNPPQDDQPIFYAIFDFLPGKDKYNWFNPHCTATEINASGKTLAQFHQAGWNFQPQGLRREPRIADLLEIIRNNLLICLAQSHLKVFNQFIQPHQSFLEDKLKSLTTLLHSPVCLGLPELIIHCDYHPGNLKFQDEQVVGLFDFDWSKLDYRLFDLALAIVYFFAEWEGAGDGELRLDEVTQFISAYQDVLQNSGDVPPLSPNEQALLGSFIESANLYVFNWTIGDLLNKEVEIDLYSMFVLHGIRTALWLDDSSNRAEIGQLFK